MSKMSRAFNVSQQKLAEKLSILCDRGVGMLTRIYNIKKACSDPKSKPSFLSDKSLEGAIKHVVKKFPNIDVKSNLNTLNAVNTMKADIVKSLALYYFTFVDLLDFKDHVSELLTTMDTCQVLFNVTTCFDLTRSYLDLVSTYASLMILLSRVEDRKVVLGVFNTAHELLHGNSDPNFPRLGQLILDYDPPMRKLAEEFVPHSKLVLRALLSLKTVYPRRNLSAKQWRSAQMLSLVTAPSQMLNPAQTETMPCEYLSVNKMEKWIVIGFTLCYQHLGTSGASELWVQALSGSLVTQVFRDEVIHTQQYIIGFFESLKGLSKRVADVRECLQTAQQTCANTHRERRKFLRTALKELATILTDQPGLLGPKALFVFMALSFSRDEVEWLLRHQNHVIPRQTKGKSNTEDFMDRALPELLFGMEELRALVKKYNQVLQRYYVQYLSGYDAVVLNECIQRLPHVPEEESVILSSFYSTMTELDVKQVEEGELFDLRGFRLDWFRLQAYTSVGKSSMMLEDNKEFAKQMNTIAFHSKMVDALDEILLETSDLSIFCFYSKLFEQHFQMCIEFPPQMRYTIAFPLVCAHFMQCTHELCPEERNHIGDRSLSVVNMFLDEMAKEAKNIITNICDEHCLLSDQLLPKNCAQQIALAVNRQKKQDKKQRPVQQPERPGIESYRKTREELTTMDLQHMALTELCFSINYCGAIHVWDHIFAPREYLAQHIETRFNKALVGMLMYNPDTQEIAKPSELLGSVRAYMSVLQGLENYVHVDVTRVFNSVLLQQTQPQDSHGEKTITAMYTNWYLDVLLRKVSTGQIMYSKNQRAFVSLTTDERQLNFNAEEYSDIVELRALSELVGPYGMKYLSESLMWHIASQVIELKKLCIQNKDVLADLRTNFDKPEVIMGLHRRLLNLDNVLQRMTIIGVILCFRQLAQEALHDVLQDRIPFLLSSIRDFHHHVPSEQDTQLLANIRTQIVNEMATAAGLPAKVDPALCTALRAQKMEGISPDEDYQISCLLMVFVAIAIPKLARSDASTYKATLEGHLNNSHCLAQAINHIAAAMFTNCGLGDIEERLKEFLALASSSLLKLGYETDKEVVRNRESVYLLLDEVVKESAFLTMDLLESCFPYALIRNAYHAVCRQSELYAG